MLGDTSKSFDPNETAKSKQSKPKADSALGNLNTEKAQVKKQMKKHKEMMREQEDLCGPKLAKKLEQYLLEFNKQAGVMNERGERVDQTAEELRIL